MADKFEGLLDLSGLEESSEIAKFIHSETGVSNYART